MSRPQDPAPDAFLPTSTRELRARGVERPDVVLVSGDAYVDHPSFAAAILGRVLEAAGFSVLILDQPDWRSAQAWRALPPPRLFWAVSAGNMDSMINHYTANRKRRNDDAYSPGGRIGRRPDRATNVYAQRCREAFKEAPVVVGGVEASLRRVAHYDYWSDKVLPSILLTSKADLLVFGMGERAIRRIAERLAAGETAADLRDMRGVAYLLGKREELPAHRWEDGATLPGDVELPSYEAVRRDRVAFAEATRKVHLESNPLNGRRLLQRHGERLLVVNPPDLPLSTAELDACYDLPYTRRPHPKYREPIPAHVMIRDSVQIMRGCFGGCTFCSITLHQGRRVQSRSGRSIRKEIQRMARDPAFKGHVSDVGGPTANMYRMRCSRPEIEARCRRLSCVHPRVCKLLDTSHEPTIRLLREVRSVPGVRSVRVSSGIRMDLARRSPDYLEELARHHVGGQLKVAPEHVSEPVLRRMKKPPRHTFEEFSARFREASARAGKEQYLVPYFIASHPGCTVDDMIELAIFLREHGYRPRQVQDFIPAPMDIATCMYHTGLDPMTMEEVPVARSLRDRAVQRALLQFFEPGNWRTVRDALLAAGRDDLIGDGPGCLIPARPPRAPRPRPEGAPTYVHAQDAGARSTASYRRSARRRGRDRHGRPRS